MSLWEPKMKIELQYKRALKQITELIRKTIESLTDPFEIITRLRTLANSPLIKNYAERAALKMVTQLFTDAGKTWRSAARVNSKGKIIFEALRRELNTPGPVRGLFYAQINRNAEIIKTMPLNAANKITNYISQESLKGRRASDIAEDIRKRFPQGAANIDLIARTEVSKTSTALTRARSEEIGLTWYVWRTSEDSRVRDSHENMDDVLINWREAPIPEKFVKGEKVVGPYHAGEIYNCRCYPQPLISLDDVKWPHKVYMAGTIKTMTRKQFEQIM